MNKNILTVIILLVFTMVNAQDTNFGIKGGANFSVFGSNVKSKIGYQAGGFTKMELSDNFYLQPELLYMQQELEKNNFTFSGITGSGNLKISYLIAPLLFKYYPLNDLFIESGPQIGLLLSAKGVAKYEGNTYNLDFKDNFKKIDLGFNVGAGYDLSEKIAINIRYNVGVTKMANSEYIANFYNRNSFISLSAGYAF